MTMKRTALLPLCLLFAPSPLFLACGESGESDSPASLSQGTEAYERDPELDVENVSARDGTISHNQGKNCMECHQAFGPGKGQFTIAGTLFDEDGEWLENSVVELFSASIEDDSEPLLRIEGDSLGNFYTTEEVPLPEAPLFVRVSSADGSLTNAMPFPISNGSCNHCHTGGFAVTLHAPNPSMEHAGGASGDPED